MALSKEELAEFEALEAEEQKQAGAKADAVLRQKLDAKRMRKKLAAKHGEHGKDFVVVETTVGLTVAFRKPHDVEVDALEGKEGDRAELEKFVLGLVIEPSVDEVRKYIAEYCGLAPSFAPAINTLMGAVRAEEAKK